MQPPCQALRSHGTLWVSAKPLITMCLSVRPNTLRGQGIAFSSGVFKLLHNMDSHSAAVGSQFPPPLDRFQHRDLVRILDVAAHRNPGRNPCHLHSCTPQML